MFERLPGFRDFYPEECAVRNHIFRNWRAAARRFGFSEYDGPLLEALDLYRAKSGEEIVEQLFRFTDRSGREVALRPELTPSLARMAGARAHSLPKPVKWFGIGEQFRYERQQRGRLRSFYQFNADILGEPGPAAEIELIALLVQSFTAFGLSAEDFAVRLSDRDLWLYFLRGQGLGDEACAGVLSVVDRMGREPEAKTREKLQPFFGDACGGSLERIATLRGLTSIEEAGAFLREQTAEAPLREAVDRRLEEWRTLLAGLGAMGLDDFVRIDLGIVRGLAYYTGFVYEAFDLGGELRALAGGGRYDHLVEKLGGPDLPAAGFAVGDVTLGELLAEKKLRPRYVEAADLFVVTGGPAEREVALGAIRAFRDAGYRVEYSLRPIAFGKQFKLAAGSGARLALIYGAEEVAAGKVKVRNLADRTEETVTSERLAEYIRGFF